MGISKQPDASRAERKAKKRKLENAIPDLPGDHEPQELASDVRELSCDEKPSKKRKRTKEYMDAEENLAAGQTKHESSKKERKKKKRNAFLQIVDTDPEGRFSKHPNNEEEATTEGFFSVQISTAENGKAPKKSKKERKAERKAREAAAEVLDPKRDEPTDDSNSNPELKVNATSAAEDSIEKKRKNNRNREKKRRAALETGMGSKTPRFIAFIGNLPYSATAASLQKHFASVKPKSIRHSTEKDDPQKSRGFAFIEFEGYDHMKTCLKLFHHSMFDDGVSPPRKINVELTGGGGGNSKDRKSKIQSKNQKLNEERARRIQEEEKVKASRDGASIKESSIHPSRRTRVQGA